MRMPNLSWLLLHIYGALVARLRLLFPALELYMFGRSRFSGTALGRPPFAHFQRRWLAVVLMCSPTFAAELI